MSLLMRTGSDRNGISWGGSSSTAGTYLYKTSWTGRESLKWFFINSTTNGMVFLQRINTGRNDIKWDVFNFSFFNPTQLSDFGLSTINYTGSTGAVIKLNWYIYYRSRAGVIMGLFGGFSEINGNEYYAKTTSRTQDNNTINLKSRITTPNTNECLLGLLFPLNDVNKSKLWVQFILDHFSTVTFVNPGSAYLKRTNPLTNKRLHQTITFNGTSSIDAFSVSLLAFTASDMGTTTTNGLRTMTFS